MRKNTLLLVTSVLIIISAAIGLILISMTPEITSLTIRYPTTGSFLLSLFTLALIGFNLYVGMTGFKNYNKPKMCKKCMTLGKIMIGLQVVSFIVSSVATGSVDHSLFTGFILSILYLYGAYKLTHINNSEESGYHSETE